MPGRHWLLAGFTGVWASVFVIPLGMFLATTSPDFAAYERKVMTELSPSPPGPFGLNAAWFFMIFFCLFIGMVFNGGVVAVLGLAAWKPHLARLVAGVFGLGCLLGTLLGLRAAVDAIQWGFFVEGLGGLLSATGLACGAVGTWLFAESRRLAKVFVSLRDTKTSGHGVTGLL